MAGSAGSKFGVVLEELPLKTKPGDQDIQQSVNDVRKWLKKKNSQNQPEHGKTKR